MLNKQTIKKGFTLIELLIVVGIIGIVAAIAIPNFMNAWDKARQKRSMADLRSWGVALSSYYVDHNFFPPSSPGDVTPTSDVYLVITRLKELSPPPEKDGWYNYFYYTPSSTSFENSQAYTIASLGKAHQQDTTIVKYFKCFECDIKLSNGQFLTRPEGSQQDSPTETCDPSLCSS